MKLMIDIPNIIQDKIFNIANSGDDMPSGIEAQLVKAIINGIPISDNATNGDMIKVMFPKAEFDNAMPFTDGRWEIMNLDTENKTRAIYKPTQLRTYADWWNAPYKRGDTE